MKIFPPNIYWILLLFVAVGCRPTAESAAQAGRAAEVALNASFAVPTRARAAATLTPRPTLTAIPTATPTLPPTFTPTPAATATPTVTPTATAAPVNRSCPESPPLKPPYERNVRGDRPWPTPVPGAAAHFWLQKPLPGGGRYLINNTFPYGYDANGSYLLHNGVDSGAALGTPLLAVGDGTVVVAQKDDLVLYGWRCDWYGRLVVIELDQTHLGRPVYALYGHVLNINVSVGDRVAMGDQVAEVGFGGAAIVPHLHFELRVGTNEFGSTRNPMLWIRPPESRGVIAGRLVDRRGRPWHGVWLRADSLSNADTEYITWTYLDDPRSLINPDDELAENFVFTDVRPGNYRIYVQVNETIYREDVTVTGGELSTVEIITE